jgi:hypothetical protein
MLGVKKLGDFRLVYAAEIVPTASMFAEHVLTAFVRGRLTTFASHLLYSRVCDPVH